MSENEKKELQDINEKALLEEENSAGTDAAAEKDPKSSDADVSVENAAKTDAGSSKETLKAEKKAAREERKAEQKAAREAARNDPARKRRLKNGSYAAAVTAILVVAVILVNFIVGAIPEKFTQADLSTGKLYSIGDTTKNLLASLDRDVTLYYITQSGYEDESVEKLVDNYAANSDHVKAVTIDSVTNPTFTQQYTDDTVTLNSVIAVSGEKSKIADYNNFYAYESYYSSSPTGFDAEGQITSAIASVALDAGATIYYTTGHNELSVSTDMSDAMSKANIDLEAVNLLSSEIPEDCTALLIFSPMTDFTEDEADKVIDYLANGGHALIVSISSALSGTETPNFDKIMAAYGVTRKGGLVMEGDTNSYVQVPYLIIPTVYSTDATSGVGSQNVVDTFPEALDVEEDEDAAYTVQTLLATSSSAYNKVNIESTLEQEDDDEIGSFALGVSVEQSLTITDEGDSDIAEDNEEDGADESSDSSTADTKITKILYYTSPALFSEDALTSLLQTYSSLPSGNTELFADALTYLTDQTVTISVEAKELTIPQTTISSGIVNSLGTVFMFVIPAAVLICGFVVWGRRRRA